MDLARLCLSKRLITVEEFRNIFTMFRLNSGNNYLIELLLIKLDASFKSTSSPKKYYETLKKILQTGDEFRNYGPYEDQTAPYKLYKLFQEMENSPDQCHLQRGELF